ncbi:hypothetical protein [Pseudomonas serbica]|uniref:hypothetical protein n=1 Tax=Pseudomonas serbica TaxID=2965074 RepID=UPI00237B60AF|nr:hypothetical protein [Pseudomonas serbica]
MPVFKLFQWIRVTCLSDPGFSFIQKTKTILDESLQAFFVLWWGALLLTTLDKPLHVAIIIPCLVISSLSPLASRFMSRMVRQTFTLVVGMGSLVLATRFSNDLTNAMAFAEHHIGTIAIMVVIGGLVTASQLMFALFEADISNQLPPRPRKPTLIGPYTKLQKLDAQFVAAHEAGHAIVLALFPHQPDDIAVVMTADVMGNNNNGWCSSVGLETHITPRGFHELYMILLLAGREAELLFVGEYSICGTTDNDKWLTCARRFLETSPTHIFFRKPASKQEFDFNAEQLEKLKAEHVEIARRLLLANQGLHAQIRDGVLEKGRVEGKELLDLLAQVKNIEGCPALSVLTDQALKADLETKRS